MIKLLLQSGILVNIKNCDNRKAIDLVRTIRPAVQELLLLHDSTILLKKIDYERLITIYQTKSWSIPVLTSYTRH